MADIETHCSHSTEDAKLFDCIDRQRGENIENKHTCTILQSDLTLQDITSPAAAAVAIGWPLSYTHGVSLKVTSGAQS